MCHNKYASWISLWIRNENKQIHNESDSFIYDCGSQEILCLYDVDSFYIVFAICHVHIKAKTCSYSDLLASSSLVFGIKNCYTGVININSVLTKLHRKLVTLIV